MAILPFLVGSYMLDANAEGKSFEFTAESPRSGQWDLSLSGNQGYYHIPIFDDLFDPTANFVEANPIVTGQFSYDTNAPARSSSERSAFYYENTFFSVDLTSENGDSRRFDTVNPYATIQNHANNQVFGVVGRDTNPPITITGNGGCNDGFCEGLLFNTELPISEMRNDFPDLFNNVSFVGVEIFSFDPIDYQLSSVDFYLYPEANGGLPTDNSLPDHLPALTDVRSNSFGIDFEHNNGFVEIEVTQVDGDFASEEEMYQKQDDINEFVQNLYPELEISINYDITELNELPDGTTPHNPILPDPEATPEEGFEFTFEANADDFTFIDPEVAVGYDYEVLEGSNFLAVLLPEGIGDDQYELWLFDEALGEFVDSGEDLTGGLAYLFGDEGLSLFRILGIETDENLDPDDPLAFVTGLKFLTEGEVSISQTPITQTVVPIPPSFVLFISGVAGLFMRRRKA